MQYVNITPEDYVERKFCLDIYNNIKSNFDDSVSLCVRNWDNENNFDGKKRIVIITSAEGHKYTPSDQQDENCMAVFMHYPPKIDISRQFDTDSFIDIDKVFALPLGSTKFFQSGDTIPYEKRKYDFSFIGQLDPYRRVGFYKAVHSVHKKYNCYATFYEGWNNGIGGEEYSKILRDSKIALVPWGTASLDTFRFYEACESGCIILSDNQNSYDFMKNSPHLVADWDYLDQILTMVLNDKNSPLVSLTTRKFWEDNLSPKACAEYIMSKVKI